MQESKNWVLRSSLKSLCLQTAEPQWYQQHCSISPTYAWSNSDASDPIERKLML